MAAYVFKGVRGIGSEKEYVDEDYRLGEGANNPKCAIRVADLGYEEGRVFQ